jgi:hypothetical protein
MILTYWELLERTEKKPVPAKALASSGSFVLNKFPEGVSLLSRPPPPPPPPQKKVETSDVLFTCIPDKKKAPFWNDLLCCKELLSHRHSTIVQKANPF